MMVTLCPWWKMLTQGPTSAIMASQTLLSQRNTLLVLRFSWFACCCIYQYINTCHFRKWVPFPNIFTAIEIAKQTENCHNSALFLSSHWLIKWHAHKICKKFCFPLLLPTPSRSFLSLSAKKLSPLVGFPFTEIYCELLFSYFLSEHIFPFNYFYDMCWVSNKRELWNDKHKHEKCRV